MHKVVVFKYLSLASILFVCAETAMRTNINFEISPPFTSIGESIDVKCWITSGETTTYGFAIYMPDDPTKYCTFNCFIDVCFDIATESCMCNSMKPNSDKSCYTNTTELTYTVESVLKNMKGPWKCQYWDIDGWYIEDVFNFDIFEKSTDPFIDGNFIVELHSANSFNCTSLNGNPLPIFIWYLRNDTYEKELNSSSHGDHSILHYTAQIEHNGMQIVCSIHQIDGETKRNFSEVLNVTYGAVVEIGPCPDLHVAENNTNMMLECIIVEQGNPHVQVFQWTIEHLKEEGKWYNITPVDISDKGLYTCQGNNSITTRSVPGTVTVDVFYHPNIITITGATEVTENDNIVLDCFSNGIPNNITYKWTTPVITSSNKTLVIKNVTKNHTGEYTCQASNSFQPCDHPYQTGRGSEKKDIIILYTPKGKPVIYTNKSIIAVNKTHTFYCFTEYLDEQGWPEVEWIIWRNNASLQSNCTMNTQCINHQFISYDVNDSGQYTCQAGNVIGGSQVSDSFSITIEAPLTFEAFNTSTSTPMYDGATSGEFILSCIGSASNIKHLALWHNGEQLDQIYFSTPNTTQYDCAGNCAYGVSAGTIQQVHWQASEVTLDNCKDILQYDGDYQCYGEATTAGVVDIFHSDIRHVETHYAPLSKADDQNHVAEYEKNVTLQCKLCANPPATFKWYFNGTGPDALIPEATSENYTVTFANETSFGFYYCEATNIYNQILIPVELKESGPAESPSNLNILPNTTSSSLSITWQEGRSGNNPPVEYIIKVGNQEASKCNENNSFTIQNKVVGTPKGIEGTTLSHIFEGLVPDSLYCVRVHGENQRPSDKINMTDEYICDCDFATMSVPVIQDFAVEEVTSNEMKIRWKYQVQYTNLNYVGLVFIYNELGKHNMTFPENDSVNATLEFVSIPGSFSESASYVVAVNLYEGNNKYPAALYIGDTFHPDADPKIGLIVGLSMFLLIILVGATVLVTQRHRLGLDSLFKEQDEDILNRTEFDEMGDENAAFEETPYAMSDMGQNTIQTALPTDPNVNDGATYAEVDKSKKKNAKPLQGGAVYAEVKKGKKKGAAGKLQETPVGAVYAEVDKTKKKNKKKGAPTPPEMPQGDTPYEDVETKMTKPPIAKKPKPAQAPDRNVSEDGCVYIKLDFPKFKPQTSGNIIHGKDQMTVYAQIDWTRTPEPVEEQAEPPPYRQEEEDVMGALPPPREADV